MSQTTTDSVSAEVLIVNKRGLHARASAKFVTCVAGMDGARVSVINKEGHEAAGGSILSLMMLGAAKGDTVTIRVSGTDHAARLAELVAMVEAGFGED
ncbi:HPr family phosphocarrier protein [Aurantiacibacter xanthus]|uniref:HPr family phosphocarrier protein n=1 Tax=Aurantiacibacter xanthus TaxID=1784712 RepID=A0A3A1PDS0_9SPHN|nr:HPr family phosphocarrier protein [Aurantiacibacter xanthus]RIV91117.1 HPr family phosphocarrier protein [Aurantiacibacter xanthus]